MRFGFVTVVVSWWIVAITVATLAGYKQLKKEGLRW